MLTNRYLDEQNDLLISIYKEKMSSENGLNLFLTSGNNLCTDINTQNDYCDINIIKCIISCLKKYNLVNFKTIFIDSNYIDSDNVTYIENELKGNIIVNTFNGQNVKKYEQYQIHNYIDDIKYYNKEALNKYILNDNNVDLDIIGKDNLEIIENDLTYFTDEIAQLLTWQEINKINTLELDDYDTWVRRTKCYSNNSLIIDVNTLNIIICPGLNIETFRVGKIFDNEIVAYNKELLIRTLLNTNYEFDILCASCVNNHFCNQKCYVKAFKETNDPFLLNSKGCKYSVDRNKYFAKLYDNVGILKLAKNTSAIDFVNYINKNMLK